MTPGQITLLTAVWGAVTGTVALLLQLQQYRGDKPDLRISAHMSTAVDRQNPKPHVTVTIDAVNHGRRAVEIQKAGVELPPEDTPLPKGVYSQKKYVSLFDTDLGSRAVELAEGRKFTFRGDPFPEDVAEKFRQRETAFVVDSRGRRYTTQFFTIKPENLPRNRKQT